MTTTCSRCKKSHNEPGKMCRKCLAYADSLRKKKLSKGNCQQCSGPLASKRFCQKCLDKQNVTYKAKLQTGECTQCKKKAAEGSSTCLLCQRRRRLWKYGISVSKYESLLARQNYKCPLCLTELGANCNIDHDHACCPYKPMCGLCVRGVICWKCNRFLVTWGDLMLKNMETAEMLKIDFPKLFLYLTTKVVI